MKKQQPLLCFGKSTIAAQPMNVLRRNEDAMSTTAGLKKIKAIGLIAFSLLCAVSMHAQPVLETGGSKPMPDEWIDKDTHHKVIKLTRRSGGNMSFYFHNNPFYKNEMVFYGYDVKAPEAYAGEAQEKKQEIGNLNARNTQIYKVNLKSLKVDQLTNHALPMNGEILSTAKGEVFYQVKDSVFATNLKTKKERLVFVFPADFKGGITTVNADGTLLGGVKSSDEEKELFRKNPSKSSYFNIIYEAKLERTLFTIDIKQGKLEKLFSDTAWLNHVQFSNTDPKLMMFCHEGPWHKVDRIWTIDVKTKKVTKIHTRSMPMEIAGHEWFGPDGKTIWFDLQKPRGATFYVAGADLATGKEKTYELQRNEWSIHFSLSPSQKLFAGDGGDSTQVAKAKDGRWIYLFRPEGDKFVSEKLVNMKHHFYKLEPNVHFSPDEKWVIFRANFEGEANVYAVEIAPSKL
ncbi:MAG TPA: oligogalacturonate lyase family protein [Phnomibacter sp.]|nr:oligogalacturonate lyase family protein [Phnomibacter sp.]